MIECNYQLDVSTLLPYFDFLQHRIRIVRTRKLRLQLGRKWVGTYSLGRLDTRTNLGKNHCLWFLRHYSYHSFYR